MAELACASDFLAVLTERGFIHQCSDPKAVDDLAVARRLVAYVGYDCTAPSLHVGNLMSIMMLYWLQQSGNKPIILVGGGTSQVGDPSGRDQSRQLLDLNKIEANKQGITNIFSKFIAFGHGARDAILVDNADWLNELNYIGLLRDVGRHFSVGRMLSMDSVRLRLQREQELSFLEFNYMVLQAYDYVQLAQRFGCNLQMGGSDQWGNIVTGIDLGRRMGTHPLHALTCPLLTMAGGAKMGKTASGAVWLDPELLSAYDYWQFWRNVDDRDIGRFLRLYTLLPMDEIVRLETLQGEETNDAKKRLATEATALIHGRAASERAATTAREAFEKGAAADGLPSVDIAPAQLEQGLGVLNAFVIAGLTGSNGEARRALGNGALKVNDVRIEDSRALLRPDMVANGVIKLSMGKKRHVLLRVR